MKNDPKTILKQISNITSALIEGGLCDSQNYPKHTLVGNTDIISFNSEDNISIALKNVPYIDLYRELLVNKCYNFMMIDGALIQLMYYFRNEELLKHRLAFFPSPNLEDYKIAQELYENDILFGDVVRDTIMPFPIRFDYTADESIYREVYHSKTHMTMGEFEYCRIPASAPLTPCTFMSFILRHFYIEDKSPLINKKIYEMPNIPFSDTIKDSERTVSHFLV